MKDLKFLVTLGVICIISMVFLCFMLFSRLTVPADESIVDSKSTTVLTVKNQNPNDTVEVYLTLNGGDGYVSDVNGIFGITSSNDTQGSFYLLPKDSVTYTAPVGKAFSGNISFWSPPLNCPFEGTTLFEFTLNNSLIDSNSQETIDISCVAGVTCIGSFDLNGGGAWGDNYQSNDIKHFQNDSLYHNTGISGVFPYGCTNCINTEGAPVCNNSPSQFANPNLNKICNVQRNAKNSGGNVIISYIR